MTASLWQTANRILAVRLDAMGDVLMTGPAIRALRFAAPGRRVTLLTSPAGAAAGRLLPGVEDVITFDAPWMKATREPSRSVDLQMIERLRRHGFDGAVIFTVFSQSPLPTALMCHLSDIPLRLAVCRENPYHLLTDWVTETEPGASIRHEVRRQLDPVSHVAVDIDDDRMRVRLSAASRGWAEKFVSGNELRAPWIIVHPGASAESRRYPVEGYAEAARDLAVEVGCQVVVSGSEAERSLVDHIVRDVPGTRSVIGESDLGRFAALMSLASLVITNNTGPAHLAAAVGTPVVSLYALTNPQHKPWRVRQRVLNVDLPCRNCFKSICPEGHNECLRGVAPRQIVEAAVELLEGEPCTH